MALLFCIGLKTPVGTRGDKKRSLATPCMSHEATKWGNLFALVCDMCRWRRGSWWLRSSVSDYNAVEVAITPLWPNIHLDGRSSMDRLDQSAIHAELIISVCPGFYVLQTVDKPPVFFLQISYRPTFPYRYRYIKRWLRVNQVFNISGGEQEFRISIFQP